MKGSNPLFDNQPFKLSTAGSGGVHDGESNDQGGLATSKKKPLVFGAILSLPFYDSKKITKEIIRQAKRTVEKRLIDDSLLQQLRDQKAKINVKETLFIAKDKTGKILWLEKGNPEAGLLHIVVKGHDSDFVKKHSIIEADLVPHLYDIVASGSVVSVASSIRKGRICYARKYLYCGKYYSVFAVGSNGFIVSAHPSEN
ncbi:MAG: hypothetical protein LKF89_03010 [Bacilli bacterium]|jgi:hypothetical protein|nr:hypothetical protein [Bacilli bacterium]